MIKMSLADLQSYYNTWVAGSKTIQQIADEIYAKVGSADPTGVLKDLIEAVRGEDMRTGLIHIVVLLLAYYAKTSDNIAVAESAIADIMSWAELTDNLVRTKTGRYYINSAGEIQTSSKNLVMGVSNLIPVSSASQYSIAIFGIYDDYADAPNATCHYAWYDSEKNLIGTLNVRGVQVGQRVGFTVSAPDNAAYLAFYFIGQSAGGARNISSSAKLLAVEGQNVPQTYIPPFSNADIELRSALASARIMIWFDFAELKETTEIVDGETVYPDMTLDNIPSWSYCVASGNDVRTLVGDGFDTSELVGTSSYIIKKISLLNSKKAHFYEITNLNKTLCWTGKQLPTATSVTWAKSLSPTDSSLTRSGVPADAEEVGKRFSAIERGDKIIKILFVGNSTNYSTIGMLPAILTECGIKSTVGILYDSGQTISGHLAKFDLDPDGTYGDADMKPQYMQYSECNGSRWTNTYGSVTAKQALNKHDWDYVVIQPNSRGGDDKFTAADYGLIDTFAKMIANYVTYPVGFLLMLTLSYNPTSNMYDPSSVEEEGTEIEKRRKWSDNWFTAVAENTEAAYEGSAFVSAVLPCGTAVQNARHFTADGDLVFANIGDAGYLCCNYHDPADGSDTTNDYPSGHLQNGIGTMIPAMAAALKIMELIGAPQKMAGLKLTPTDAWLHDVDKYNLSSASYYHGTTIMLHGSCQGVTKDNLLRAAKCAICAIKKPYEITEMEEE